MAVLTGELAQESGEPPVAMMVEEVLDRNHGAAAPTDPTVEV